MGKKIRATCTDNIFSIKCKDEKQCQCKTAKKPHFQKITTSFPSKDRKWCFLRKKKFRGKTSYRCFLCKKKSHFARNCPKKAQAAHLLQQAKQFVDSNFSDVESQLSLKDDYSPDSLLVIPYESTTDNSVELSDTPLNLSNADSTSSYLVQPTPTARIHMIPNPFALRFFLGSIGFFWTASSRFSV